MVIGDGIWMRAPLATPWDALAAALNWPADIPVWTANICSSFCTVNVIRAARAWHSGSIVLNHCLKLVTNLLQSRRPFWRTGMSSVRYGTRLGDLKENWFLLFSN